MKILIAADGSEFSSTAIDACRDIVAKPENTAFRILSTVDFPNILPSAQYAGPTPDYYYELEKVGNEQAREVIGRAETQLRTLFPEITLSITKEVMSGSPGPVIVEEAERWGADLIVVGSHGYGFWSRTFLGSVSQAIVHHAPCSVLVVRRNKKGAGQDRG